MEVIILAGGLGTRLRSEVKDVPKCMAPVAGKPFLWYLLTYLKRYPVSRVILSVGYLREVIKDWIAANGNRFPYEIDYAVEEVPLGTGGGIRLALDKCRDENVVVLNGDTFFDVDLDRFMAEHVAHPASVSIAMKPMHDFDRYGRVIVDLDTDRIEQFCEKEPCTDGLINGGVYAINRGRLDLSALPDKFSFEKEVLEPESAMSNVYGYVFDGYFIDIGIPEDYHKADREFPKLFDTAR